MMIESPKPARPDEGFTLIELLVVIIIIGILAAIAIPVFLNQRNKGYDTQAKADLASLAEFEEIYLNDNSTYGTGAQLNSQAGPIRHSPDDALSVYSFTGASGYCLKAVSLSGITWWYDSEGGGLQPQGATGCPTTYSTTGGSPIP